MYYAENNLLIRALNNKTNIIIMLSKQKAKSVSIKKLIFFFFMEFLLHLHCIPLIIVMSLGNKHAFSDL